MPWQNWIAKSRAQPVVDALAILDPLPEVATVHVLDEDVGHLFDGAHIVAVGNVGVQAQFGPGVGLPQNARKVVPVGEHHLVGRFDRKLDVPALVMGDVHSPHPAFQHILNPVQPQNLIPGLPHRQRLYLPLLPLRHLQRAELRPCLTAHAAAVHLPACAAWFRLVRVRVRAFHPEYRGKDCREDSSLICRRYLKGSSCSVPFVSKMSK